MLLNGGGDNAAVLSSSPAVRCGELKTPHTIFLSRGEKQLLRSEVALSIFEEYGTVMDSEDYELVFYRELMKIQRRDGIDLFHVGEREGMERRLSLM